VVTNVTCGFQIRYVNSLAAIHLPGAANRSRLRPWRCITPTNATVFRLSVRWIQCLVSWPKESKRAKTTLLLSRWIH